MKTILITKGLLLNKDLTHFRGGLLDYPVMQQRHLHRLPGVAQPEPGSQRIPPDQRHSLQSKPFSTKAKLKGKKELAGVSEGLKNRLLIEHTKAWNIWLA